MEPVVFWVFWVNQTEVKWLTQDLQKINKETTNSDCELKTSFEKDEVTKHKGAQGN